MRVLFLYKYLTLGGVETVLRARLVGLAKLGIEAEAWFLTSGPGETIFREVESQFKIGTLDELAQYLRDVSFDVISSLDTEEVFPILRRLPAGTKLTLEVHTPYPESLAYLYRLERVPIDAVLVPSDYQIGVVKEYLKKEVDFHVVPNPLGDAFVERLKDFRPVPKRAILAWLGRIDVLKNWREFLEIAGVLLTKGLDFECWLIGRDVGERGEERVLRIAEGARILDRLRWFRGVDYQHLPRFLDAVRASGGIVVSTSKGDSFGMTVAEGMARGCAVLVPYEGPFEEIVKNGVHGYSYDLGNYYDAVGKVSSMLLDDEMRTAFGRRGRESILASHAPVVALGAFAEVLREVRRR
jgi:glycosyltransferase involved in cell wall biosynthesis